jgi:DNA polymerase I-like protein with 3'-5' exonuclease and polymerase domains
VFEDTPENILKYQPQVISIMENVANLRVPLKVNTK